MYKLVQVTFRVFAVRGSAIYVALDAFFRYRCMANVWESDVRGEGMFHGVTLRNHVPAWERKKPQLVASLAVFIP